MNAPRSGSLPIRALNTESSTREEEPVSPTARLLDSMYIVVTIGLGASINQPDIRAGIQAQLARHPRFCSIQVTDEFKDGNPRWVRATVNLDDHVVVPGLDPDAVAADPDQAVEDYVASLSTLPMDRSRPLWEFHFLDFPTSEAAATVAVRVHHSLADGMSLLTLLMACTRSAADPTRLPAMPPPPARSGPVFARPRPPASAGALPFALWLWSYVVLAWHTVEDVVAFVAMILFVSDPHTLFKRTGGSDLRRRKRFVHTTLSLDDVKFVKNAMKCTVNDVLVGTTSAALSQYYFRESGDTDTRKLICLRSILVVNIRPPASLHAAAAIFSRIITRASMAFTNVIGPVEQVQFCGHPIAFIAPSIYGAPEALTIHYQSYNNSIKLVLAVDEAHFACRRLLNDFTSSLRRIRDAAALQQGSGQRQS
ncbi:wax ester synthase/diacylglycerol acyltransferase 11-like isoform X3 [Miscanthus floridulus]|uniref:wax ester synthase/diacylglycerol acyltransferase 11-like isoform X3 n=1 Tax=Miscanthus floridulus TaxID=154761 RepID=UPI0034588455